MGDIAEAFEQHLRSLSDEQWNSLVARVRPVPPPAGDGSSGEAERQHPGDSARAAAAKRFGKQQTTETTDAAQVSGPAAGAAGRAAAARRFPQPPKESQ
jgi:hypothetical protein